MINASVLTKETAILRRIKNPRGAEKKPDSWKLPGLFQKRIRLLFLNFDGHCGGIIIHRRSKFLVKAVAGRNLNELHMIRVYRSGEGRDPVLIGFRDIAGKIRAEAYNRPFDRITVLIRDLNRIGMFFFRI